AGGACRAERQPETDATTCLPTPADPQIKRSGNSDPEPVCLGERLVTAQTAVDLLQSLQAVTRDVGELGEKGETGMRLVFPRQIDVRRFNLAVDLVDQIAGLARSARYFDGPR